MVVHMIAARAHLRPAFAVARPTVRAAAVSASAFTMVIVAIVTGRRFVGVGRRADIAVIVAWLTHRKAKSM
jgi:hypothetical protein